ncbi:MAG: lipopolysaccharide biosynthesis protein [Bacteroidaceae bacterium]
MVKETLKEKTAKGLFWGGLSNSLQQLLGLAFGICLARLLSPGDYGMVAMLTVFSLLASSIQESGFVSALAIRKEVHHRDYNAVFWFSLLASVSLYVVLFFCAPLIAAYNHTPELTPLARYAFLGFVLSSLSTAHFAVLFRKMKVKQRTIATFVATVVSGGVGITMAACGFAYWGLATQDLCYKLVITLLFWHYSGWRPTFQLDFRPIRQMFGFSSKVLATNLLNTINNQFLQALLGHFYPRGDVGLYSQANKWNTMGYSIVGGMVGSIAQPVFAQVGNERSRQQRVFRKMLRFTAFLSFPAMLGLALIATDFVPLALGNKWVPCVPYLQILCVAGSFIPLSQLYSNLIVSSGRSSVYLSSTAVLLLLQLATMYFLYPYGITALLYAITTINIVSLFVWHFLAARQTGLKLIHTLMDIVPFAFLSAAVMWVAYITTLQVDHMILRFILKIVIAVLLYGTMMWFLRIAVFRECLHFLLRKKSS